MSIPALALVPSKRLACLLTFAYTASAVFAGYLFLNAYLSLWLSPIVASLLILGFYRDWRIHALKQADQAIISLQWHEYTGECLLRQNNGQLWHGQLLTSSIITSQILLLHFKCRGKVRSISVLILPDGYPAKLWHEVQSKLRFYRLTY